jgi:hypothetical protein
MANLSFSGQWTNSSKPYNVDMPFHRITCPAERLFPQNRLLSPIDGFGYRCGCRSSQDYDAKTGQDIADMISDLINKTPLGVVPKVTRTATDLIKKIPIIGPIISPTIEGALKTLDPIKLLLKFLGKKIDALLVDSLIRATPNWVPIDRNPANKKELRWDPRFKDDGREREVDGFLLRSYQRMDSLPLAQWHHWYDWKFTLFPSPDFFGIIGEGNRRRDINTSDLNDPGLKLNRYDGDGGIPGRNVNHTFDCEWDMGAFGPAPGAIFNSPFGVRDWAWPMSGQFMWAIGRAVYDCSHATSDLRSEDLEPGAQPNDFDPGQGEGMMLNQLHPCRAIATARWEAVKFDDNEFHVPAIQFMFFTSKFGGYFDFPRINGEDYEFIVDLPKYAQAEMICDIGSTPTFPLNTLVLRPRLLVKFDFSPFKNARGKVGATPDPVVELLDPPDPARPPEQAKIKFPLTELPDDVEAYGVIVSLGWHDPNLVEAAKVRKVTVSLESVSVHGDAHDNSGAEWVINVGINGRWLRQRFEDVGSKSKLIFDDPKTVTLFLAEDDAVSISAHGLEEDGLDDFFRKPRDLGNPDGGGSPIQVKSLLADRVLRLHTEIKNVSVPFIGRRVDWKQDVDQSDMTRASQVIRAIFARMVVEGAIDANDPLGLIDPNVSDPAGRLGRKNDPDSKSGPDPGVDSPNPFKVKDLLQATQGLGVPVNCQLTAYATEPVGRMGVLAYDPQKIDYRLLYTIKVEPQFETKLK